MCLIPVMEHHHDVLIPSLMRGTGPHPANIFCHNVKKEFHLESLTRRERWWWSVEMFSAVMMPGLQATAAVSAACNNPAVITIIQSDPLASEPIFAASSSRVENRKIPETMWHYWVWWHLLLPGLVTMGPVVSRHLFVWQPRPGTGAVTLSAWPEFVTRCHPASRVTFPSRMWRQYF